jgi:hypothetical protein
MPILARFTAVVLLLGHFPEMITYGAQSIRDNVRRIFPPSRKINIYSRNSSQNWHACLVDDTLQLFKVSGFSEYAYM